MPPLPKIILFPPKSWTDRELLKSPKCRNLSTLTFFNKQPGYKQLAFEWQIAKQLSGLNSFSLSDNKNYRLKKSRVFPL